MGAGATALVVGLGAALQLVIVAYLAWGLPRLRTVVGVALSAFVASLLLVAVLLEPTGSGLVWAFALGVSSLLAGHAGWWLARAQPHGPTRAAASVAPASARAATRAAPLTASPASDRTTLGRYHIEHQLGRGAMGAVYLGRDPQIGRLVAIKTMALGREFQGAELAEARARFFREAETAGRLQHPDIVTIFDAGEDQDLAYIAMEYVRGRDLLQHTLPGRLLPVQEVLGTVARVAEALAYAHTQGVVHRDVKPANVMVDAATGSVKVTDFGIARITDHSRTRTGVVLGTPSFMSPEQLAGRSLDGRSDLYSLGVMLFQLLTGALPHDSESMAELLYQIANDPAPSVRARRPELPEALAGVVALALEKRPELRYADGLQMARDLRSVKGVTELPASAVLPPPDSRRFEDTLKFARPDTGHNSDS